MPANFRVCSLNTANSFESSSKFMAKALFFDFYGVSLQLNFLLEDQHFLEEQLLADFSFFRRAGIGPEPTISIDISLAPASLRFSGTTWFRTGLCHAKQNGVIRSCLFHGGNQIEDSGNEFRRATLYVKSPSSAYEALYYYILSAVGEALDYRGIHRLHAVAYSSGNAAFCLPRDSMGGKTTRALKILASGTEKLFGDEVIFTDGVKLFAFPIRLAVRPDIYSEYTHVAAEPFQRSLGGRKYLVRIPQHRVAMESDSFQLDLAGNSLAFSFKFLLGLGVPQMREFMIRPNSIRSLWTIFWLRFSCLRKLLRHR